MAKEPAGAGGRCLTCSRYLCMAFPAAAISAASPGCGRYRLEELAATPSSSAMPPATVCSITRSQTRSGLRTTAAASSRKSGACRSSERRLRAARRGSSSPRCSSWSRMLSS